MRSWRVRGAESAPSGHIARPPGAGPSGPVGGAEEAGRDRRRGVARGGGDLGLGEEQAAAQVRPADVGVAQVGAQEIRRPEVGAAQVRTDQVGTAQVRVAEITPAEIGTYQIGVPAVGTVAGEVADPAQQLPYR